MPIPGSSGQVSFSCRAKYPAQRGVGLIINREINVVVNLRNFVMHDFCFYHFNLSHQKLFSNLGAITILHALDLYA